MFSHFNDLYKRYQSLERFDAWFSKVLGKFGINVCRHPYQYIFIPLLISTIMATGLQQFRYTSDPEVLFVPSSAPFVTEKQIIRSLFPMNNSKYILGGESMIPQLTDIILVPKDRGNVIRPELWAEAERVAKAISLIEVVIDEERFTWETLCVRLKGECVANDFLSLHKLLGQGFKISYPVTIDPRTKQMYLMAFHLGGVKDGEKILSSARAMKLMFILDDSNKRKKRAGEIWALAAMDFVSNLELEYSDVYAITNLSLERELMGNIDSMAHQIPVCIVIVVAFTIYNCMGTDWVRSKPIMGMVGLIITVIAAFSSFGIVMYFKWEWQAINLVVIILMIGIGLDDTFVMLSAWWRSECPGGRDLETRMYMTYADAAISITITTLTNVLSFAIGAIVPGFPCVQIFCVYAGVGLLFVYLNTITIFGGCLVLCGLMEEQNRHCLLFLKVLSKTEADNNKKGLMYRTFLAGGVSKTDSLAARDNKEGKVMSVFRDVIAPFINNSLVKTTIICIFVAYLGVSIWGILKLKEGLERNKLASDESYILPYFEVEQRYFRDHPYRLQVVIHEEVDYFNTTVRKQVLDFIHKLEDSEFITADKAFRQSWLHTFLQMAKEYFIVMRLDTRELFYQNLFKFMVGAQDTQIGADVVFNENKSSVLASRFFLQTTRLENAIEEVRMLQSVRQIADEAPFKVVIYHPFFGFFDQYAAVVRTTVECTISCMLCMTVITLIFIPNKVCVIWVIFTIVSVEVGVVGLMALADINIDVISMIMLIMSIGFSVDFSAHISYHYLSADHGTGHYVSPLDRLAYSLHGLGAPVLQGAASTLLAIVGAALHPSYITRAFAKMILLIISLGVMHGILLLPVLLTILGPGGIFSKQKPEKKEEILSPISLSGTFVYQSSNQGNSSSSTTRKACETNATSSSHSYSFSDVSLSSGDEERTKPTGAKTTSKKPKRDAAQAKSFRIQQYVSEALRRPRSQSVGGGLEQGPNAEESPVVNPLPYYNFAHVRRNSAARCSVARSPEFFKKSTSFMLQQEIAETPYCTSTTKSRRPKSLCGKSVKTALEHLENCD